ncbi:hypothetical protein JW865_04035 [Candidatus Bathyarchaeota archaeon]|nr:hypothetical protein [Candidatus Bathyarchaeota archaeon]
MGKDIYEWLMQNAGPIIKYRTKKELLEEDPSSFEYSLLVSNLVVKSLKQFNPIVSPNSLHSSKPEAFENCMGRLYEFGLRKGLEPFDNYIQPYLNWLNELALSQGNQSPFSWFYLSLIAGYLSMIGFFDEKEVDFILKKRLDDVTSFTKINLKEIYIEPKKISKIPKNFQGRPILNPEIINEHSILPNIHDFNGFLHSSSLMKEKRSREKIEKAVNFILSNDYQKLEPGYGVLYQPKNKKFYSAGWSLHLFNYYTNKDFEEKVLKSICFDKSNLLRLSLFSRSKRCREHFWFKNSIDQLEKHLVENGKYQFPREMLKQKKSGYWVSGKSLSLEENRTTLKAIQIESTFRYHEIIKEKY